jgi:ketosteroid isomerase-like protein
VTDSANVDLVRSIYADWERGDFSSVEWAHPKIEFVTADGPEPGNMTAKASQELRDFLSVWDDYRTEVEEYRQLANERILVIARSIGRGKSSGAEIAHTRANVFHLEGGVVTRLVFYWDVQRALADLGLKE